MSEDKLIVSVLPFQNPANEAERRLNDMAMKLYLDPDARKGGRGTVVFAGNPSHPGHMYQCIAGWTKEGWRTYTACMDPEQLVNFCDTAIDAEQESLRMMDEMKRAVNRN